MSSAKVIVRRLRTIIYSKLINVISQEKDFTSATICFFLAVLLEKQSFEMIKSNRS